MEVNRTNNSLSVRIPWSDFTLRPLKQVTNSPLVTSEVFTIKLFYITNQISERVCHWQKILPWAQCYNIKLAWKGLPGTNTLAYYEEA